MPSPSKARMCGLFAVAFATAVVPIGCSSDEGLPRNTDVEDLGPIGGKADGETTREVDLTLGPGEIKRYRVTAAQFRASLTQTGEVPVQLSAKHLEYDIYGDPATEPTVVAVADGTVRNWTLRVHNQGTDVLHGTLLVEASETVTLTILHTTDEHGWLDAYAPEGATKVRGGVANLLGLWKNEEHFRDGSHLVLSGGDNMSGPAVSTWYRGEPAIEAMNFVGYQASVIGNHELDFGVGDLRQRIDQAQFPYLGANIIDESTGEVADFAIPYVVIPHHGVNVGVIGVTTPDTATDAHPLNVAGLRFDDIATTLEAQVPNLREREGADVVVVIAHECCPELEEVASGLGVDVDLMFGAHCHRRSRKEVNGIPIVCSGSYWRYYGRVDLTYNRATGEVEGYEASVPEVAYAVDEEPIEPDAELQLLVDGWTQRAREELGASVGYNAAEIENASWTMGNWITDAWMWAFPEADMAIEIFGGMRQSIPAGPFTEYDVVGMLPFDNVIYQVELTGSQVIENLDRATTDCYFRTACYPAVAGIRYARNDDVFSVTFPDGTPLDPEGTYRVLVNDFLYYGGVSYDLMDHAEPIVDTGVFTRQPVIEYTRALGTSEGKPLESLLDSTPRDQ